MLVGGVWVFVFTDVVTQQEKKFGSESQVDHISVSFGVGVFVVEKSKNLEVRVVQVIRVE